MHDSVVCPSTRLAGTPFTPDPPSVQSRNSIYRLELRVFFPRGLEAFEDDLDEPLDSDN